MRARSAAAFVLLLAVACGAQPATSPATPTSIPATTTPAPSTTAPRATTAMPSSTRVEDLVAQFRYDAAVPLATRVLSSATSGNVAVSEIEFANARGAIAKATLLVPDGAGKRPALVMAPGSNQSRTELRAEALDLASSLGAVTLVVDQSQVASGRDRVWTFTAQDREEAIESVVDLLRGIDLLVARTDVDSARIGLHGFSYGAWLAVIAAAADRRASVVVLRSGGPQILRELAGPSRASAASFAAYLETMTTVDQSRFAPALPGATAVLVQNGSADPTYPADGVRAWQAAIGGAKTARFYDGAGHLLNTVANDEAKAFLRDRWRP
jgi:dienelactone hydrolase